MGVFREQDLIVTLKQWGVLMAHRELRRIAEPQSSGRATQILCMCMGLIPISTVIRRNGPAKVVSTSGLMRHRKLSETYYPFDVMTRFILCPRFDHRHCRLCLLCHRLQLEQPHHTKLVLESGSSKGSSLLAKSILTIPKWASATWTTN